MESEKIIETLRMSEIFNHLSKVELRSIAELGKLEVYDIGEIIYHQGTVGENLYILSEGQISLHRKIQLGNGREGVAIVYISREEPNRRLLGGWNALIGEPHIQMCSAKCDKTSRIVSIPVSDIRLFLEKDTELRVKILEKLVLLLKDRLESSYVAMETL